MRRHWRSFTRTTWGMCPHGTITLLELLLTGTDPTAVTLARLMAYHSATLPMAVLELHGKLVASSFWSSHFGSLSRALKAIRDLVATGKRHVAHVAAELGCAGMVELVETLVMFEDGLLSMLDEYGEPGVAARMRELLAAEAEANRAAAASEEERAKALFTFHEGADPPTLGVLATVSPGTWV